MFEERYQKAYRTITPSQELVSDTISKAVSGSRLAVKNRFAVRTSLTAAAAVLCLVVAVPVCAAHIPAFYKIVEYISPALADLLSRLRKSAPVRGSRCRWRPST